jgi:hypothetical protein
MTVMFFSDTRAQFATGDTTAMSTNCWWDPSFLTLHDPLSAEKYKKCLENLLLGPSRPSYVCAKENCNLFFYMVQE